MPNVSKATRRPGRNPTVGRDRRARLRVEGAIVQALDAPDKVSQRAAALDPERSHAVGQAVHAARVSVVEALRRRGREEL